MSFILGISEGSLINIGLVVLPLLIGTFLRHKTKADKSEIMIDVVKKIDDEIAPVVKRLKKHEDKINKLVTKQEVIHTNVDHILTGQANHKEDFKTRMTKLESLIGKLFDKVDSKKDK